LGLPEVYGRLRICDLFIAIGTSGHVYPAAGFVQATPASCQRIEINLDETPVSAAFHRQLRGRASEHVLALVAELMQLWETGEASST
jgi:NAD-dependent deacetylase